MLLAVALIAAVPAASAERPATTSGGLPQLNVLQPGMAGFLFEALPVNVVFVGYDEGEGPLDIDVDAFTAAQTPLSFSVAMMPVLFGRMVPTYTAAEIDLRVIFADTNFEDLLFAELAAIGEERQPTSYQEDYNNDPNSSLTIERTLAIDAPTVEAWLVDHAQLLGVDPSEPTAFFLNWYGRDDFVFHTYTTALGPPADSHTDFGTFDDRAMTSWGGTVSDSTSRVWFFDPSAGPMRTTQTWDLTTADVTGDGLVDYRLPPVWEYLEPTDATYRRFDDLTGDLAKVLRYVAINGFFAPSPLYPPTIGAPRLPETISVDVTKVVHPDRPSPPLSPDVILEQLQELQPWNDFRITETTTGFDGRLAAVHRCWVSGWQDPSGVGQSCYGQRGLGFATIDLWLYLRDHWLQYTSSDSDHAIPTLLFSLPEEESVDSFIAVAPPDQRDGSQSHVITYWTPTLEEMDWGHTHTVVHELGHHLGLSHPHDGVDSQFDPVTGVTAVMLYQPRGDFYFTFLAGTSATVMSYLHLATGFSQFDLDAMGRWTTLSYLNQAAQVLVPLGESRHHHRVHDQILLADQYALFSVLTYLSRDYRGAAWYAKAGYELLLGAADQLNIQIQPQALPAQIKAPTAQRFFVDPVPPYGTYRTPDEPAAYQLSLELHEVTGGAGPLRWVDAERVGQPAEFQPTP